MNVPEASCLSFLKEIQLSNVLRERHNRKDGVQEIWWFAWGQWPDVLALAGDQADNIPGVKGIGIKLAPAMVAQAGSLEALLADTDQVTALPCRCFHPLYGQRSNLRG